MSVENTRTAIDIEHWKRKNHFNFYKDFPDPNFNICFNLDITVAFQFAKRHHLSPFLVLMYLSSNACNSVEAFRIRLNKQKKPYIISCVQPSATVANNDGLFNFCNMQHHNNLSKFIDINSELVDDSKKAEPLAHIDNDDCQIFYSITPWLSFTGYKHAKGNSYFDIPKIVFGKFDTTNDKVAMPVSIELHHAIADAIDIAKYEQSFIKHMSNLALE